jgi:hypothetical protein
MERDGLITLKMRSAGENFQRVFTASQIDPLPSSINFENREAHIEAARDAVWRAIQAVGGLGSPAGSCLWYVVGFGRTTKEWAREQEWSGRRINEEVALGILIAALGSLSEHTG